MLRPPGHGRTSATDRALAASLAGIAGAANAIALRATGVFSANMTGNVSWVSDHLAAGGWASAAFFLGVVLAFIGGSFACAAATGSGARRRAHGVYAGCLWAEAGLLAALSVTCWRASPQGRLFALSFGLAFVMGAQNALATRLSDAKVRATHLSGICTDLGIELSNWMGPTAATALPRDRTASHEGLLLQLITIASFCAGGVIGAIAFEVVGTWALLLVAAGAAIAAVLGSNGAPRAYA